MPVIPPATINDLPSSERKKAQDLMYERALLQYSFSYTKLKNYLSLEDMRRCIIAYTEEECGKAKKEINDRITDVFTENGIEKTLRFADPFGRPKDFIMMEGVATSFAQSRALPLVVSGVFLWECPDCGIDNYTVENPNVKVFCSNEECKHFKHSVAALQENKKLKLKPLSDVEIKRHYSMPAEAIQAVFSAATTKTSYVTLQARDVKEENENGRPKAR